MSKTVENLLAATIIMAIIAAPVWYFCNEENKKYEAGRALIGTKVVVNKDTLTIVDYRNFFDDGMYTLSNRVKI